MLLTISKTDGPYEFNPPVTHMEILLGESVFLGAKVTDDFGNPIQIGIYFKVVPPSGSVTTFAIVDSDAEGFAKVDTAPVMGEEGLYQFQVSDGLIGPPTDQVVVEVKTEEVPPEEPPVTKPPWAEYLPNLYDLIERARSKVPRLPLLPASPSTPPPPPPSKTPYELEDIPPPP